MTTQKAMTKTSSTTVKKLPVLHRLIHGMTSNAYHGTEGTWSSSQLKVILEDEEDFIRKYIKKSAPKLEGEALDTGTYLHTAVLEPHLVKDEFAIFTGKTRYGGKWESFKAQNVGKCVITLKQKEQGDGMVKAVMGSPVSMTYLQGDPEVSLFVKLVVWNGQIHAPHYKKVLTHDGWMPFVGTVGSGFEMIVKVRADCLGENFVSDLKSTAGRANKSASIQQSISKYQYDLSAALYLDLFSLVNNDVTEFIWIFASKENPCAAPYRATRDQKLVGRRKYMKALLRLADLSAAKWEIVDYLREVDPLPHEYAWLKEKETDLL